MAREIQKHGKAQKINVEANERARLAEWIHTEVTDAFSSRSFLEHQWREAFRLYEGIPEKSYRQYPVENAPNIEITTGAIAADAIYAQAIDLIFQAPPLITCRPVPNAPSDEEANARSKAFQRWVNWVAANEARTRFAAEELVLDDVQLGTGVLYIPWVERQKKMRTAKVLSSGPRLRALAPEDFIASSGAEADLEDAIWVGARFWRTKHEMAQFVRANGWDMEGVQPAGAKSWVRSRRESVGRQAEGITRKGELYDAYDFYCYYDIDGDGIDEDLYVVYNHTGRKVMYVSYNPQDRRPFEICQYQRRAHLLYGLGVLEMVRPFQMETTELHNAAILNSLLANARFWKCKDGSAPDNMRIWAGKKVYLRDPDDIKAEAMADVYPSIWQAQAMAMQLGERRVGVNEMSMPRPSQVMGSRTPGITALSLLQQYSKRFAPAFDGMRICLAGGMRQCMYRYQERLLSGAAGVPEHIIRVLGPVDGEHVINVLRDESFDEHIDLELTATSASVNREADRQSAIMLTQILREYYKSVGEMAMAAANPQLPQQVRDVLVKVSKGVNEAIDRTIRAFDQVRDPALFIVEIEEELQAQTGMGSNAIEQLLGAVVGQGAPGGALPPPEIGGEA